MILSMRTESALLRESEKNCEKAVNDLICLMYSIAGPGVLLTLTIISLVYKLIEFNFLSKLNYFKHTHTHRLSIFKTQNFADLIVVVA